MDMRRLVGENVRRVRQEKGLTQEQLAEASGFRLDEATVAYWVTFSDEAIRLPILIAAQQTGTRVICRTSHGACYNRVENCSHACLGGANRSIFSGLSPEDEQMVDTLDSPHWTPGPWRADPGGGNCYSGLSCATATRGGNILVASRRREWVREIRTLGRARRQCVLARSCPGFIQRPRGTNRGVGIARPIQGHGCARSCTLRR